ncbi:TBC1 domain family member 16-like isoform X1 [Penaeus monodon]|uniref:TBC1 domain family member 16-like isoform X1 n=1 Tax=Penaeus monodon TaxID=6687 RepID=UPI0018A79D36|nr:TBC1 domain family member 16-like isoform X1 [Penaeus monodon]XP_037799682.1 TBC1 domain family member 16-like isoform X1 [Penaeus monodon]XP_037799683.1 TBC1 domain family member 16-like isoform X1 [Penaeus monodon]
MSLNGILRRASSFLGITGADPSKQMYEDGDIVFCKNNVCVHPPSRYRCDGERVHHPGYLVIKCRADSTLGTTLHLNWIPNDRLRRNHELISQMKYVGLEGSSSSNSPCPTSDSESLSVSSLVLHDGNSTVRKTSLDDAAMSTSGISSMDTASEVTQPKDENSPNSEGSSSVEQPKEKDEGDGVETIESGDPSSEEREERKNEEATSEGEGERNDTWATVENEEKRDEDMGEEKGAKSISDEEENTETGDEITKDSQESEQSDLLASNEEGAEDRDDEDSREDSGSSGDVEEVDKEGTLRARDMHKLRYISSDSSSDGEKPAETLTIAKGKGNPLQGPQLQSEGEDSLDSSPEPQLSPTPHYFTSSSGDQYWYERSAESMAYSANLAFPDSSLSSFCPTPVDGGSSPIRREHKCGIFSIDVSQCRSLRLFFSDREHTCGQLVIASQESQYKIFHFHHGGLDKLASVFEDWNFLVKPQDEEGKAMDSALKQFMVCRPQVSESECHPEEGQHPRLDAELWITYFSEDGMIEDDLTLRRAIFFGGVEPQLRANVWPFLLHYYDYRTTFVQRQAIMEEKHQIYEKINLVRENMSGEERDWFMRNVQCTVEKDVVRTDRSNPCFAGNDNPNLEKMKRILLNFAVHNPVMGYTQGMSDILAPILAEVRNEADVFWCFTGLMSKTIFVTSPKDEDMEKNLSYLRELLRIMVPRFYNHMASQQDGMDLLFCHRWILLCFKREFPEDEALAMWEACWSNYQTDYFHLFLVVAIVSMYGNDVVDQNLRPDETLLYFTSLANHMDGRMALQKARGLLHQYRSMSHLPCTLVGLCELCGPGMWDSGHVPVVTCVGHPDDKPCPLNQPSSNTDGNTSSTTAS